MAHKKTKKKKKQVSNDLLKGRLEIVKSGMGFVIVEGLERDIIVKPDKLGTALDGDEVRVEITGAARRNGRQEGVIKEVVRRGQTEFSGTLEVKEHFAFLIPDKHNMPVDIFIPIDLLNGAKNGDKAIVKITEWTAKAKNPVGEVVSILTNESSNEVAMQGILVDNGFPLHFPDDVMEEAARISETIDEEEIQQRRDFRKILTITIDPVDAKDFDDAISFRELEDGTYEIGVHIADVAHYVKKDSPLDEEAYKRATSVYLPDRVLPMLPERLSNQLCSLRPDEEKYTFSAVFEITKEGRIKNYWLGKTVIRSARRFTYEEVQEMIEGAEGDHKKVVMLLNQIAQNLRKERFKKGAINFSSQEVRFKLDENAKPIGIVVKESKEAHQLIEEFMLLANKHVAAYVSEITVKDKPVPFPYRVHDVPDEEKLKMFTTFAARFGHRFDLNTPEAIARSFNEMLKEAQGKPEQHVLESLGIRTMAKAVYTTDNIGHYGLGFDNYCHFTSPIRRYPDILVHRVLLECLNDDIKPVKHMETLCRHCSEMERKAMEAERTANKYKQVEFMEQYVGEEFEAVVSGAASFGFWAETVEHKCEGMVSVSDLSQYDDFEMLENEYALVGRNTGIRFRIGDKVKVRVAAANLDKRQIDFVLVEMPQQERRPLAKTEKPKEKTQKTKQRGDNKRKGK
ncbi:MAG TPA: ribonuclease R [Flavipsychrobacter sp.]|nr:ribonuclease R [Flavipsychrobacter sp.]